MDLKHYIDKDLFIALMFVVAASILPIVAAEKMPAAEPAVTEAAEDITTEKAVMEKMPESGLPEAKEEKKPEYSPTELNLVKVFPEGADPKDPMQSAAGSIFTALAERETAYLADLTALSDRTPAEIVTMFPADNPLQPTDLLGKFNPDVPGQVITDPNTWVINKFTNVNVDFFNGDGAMVDDSMLLQEVISMASVYGYYHNPLNVEIVADYANRLWENAHSTTVYISNVYYCDGCMHTPEGMETATGSEVQELTEQALLDAGYKKENIQMIDGEYVITGIHGGPGIALSETVAESNAAAETQAAGNAQPGEAGQAAENGQPGEAGQAAETGQPGEAGQAAENGQVSAEGGLLPDGSPADPQTATLSYCPGHIDLNINITVKGINDSNGLFTLDEIGNSEANIDKSWRGWTVQSIAQAKTLNEKNWSEEYGLSPAAVFHPVALTPEEIKIYMSQLPQTVDPKRLELIRYALNSVGKIPYYWGGKPKQPGYDGNDFGTIVTPDYMGRNASGLDCSGWIQWVYWSALGTKLPAESTGTLIQCGRWISRNELKPGDIMVRTGSFGHVAMFLGWTADGKMIVIHENSGNNNVGIGVIDTDWPYYRSLLD